MTRTGKEDYVVVVNAEGRLVRARKSSRRGRRLSTRRAQRKKRPRDRTAEEKEKEKE